MKKINRLKNVNGCLVYAITFILVLGILPNLGVLAESIGNQTRATYEIYDVNDLQDMSLDLTGDYILMNDIDASVTETWNYNTDDMIYNGFIPIGTWANHFTGTFNGNNYNISGLYINRTGYYGEPCGLFGFIQNSIIENVHIVDVDIYVGIGDHKAGLVGYAVTSHIYNSSVTGKIIVPTNADGCVGGLLGWGQQGTTIDRCISDVFISSDYMVGGIAGYMGEGFVNESYSSGTLICTTFGCGGIVGQDYAYIRDCYSITDITGNIYVGGIVGYGNPSLISNSYFAGNITYVTGDVITYGTPTIVTGLYFDTEVTGILSSIFAEAKTTSEMKTESTFVDWDFDNIWGIDEGTTYPFLTFASSEPEGGEEDGGNISIISSIPENNQTNVSINANIIIVFNATMNVTSVEDNLNMTSFVNYTFGWTENNTILTISFNDSLEYNTTYFLTLNTNATDESGNPLNETFMLQFTTEIEVEFDMYMFLTTLIIALLGVVVFILLIRMILNSIRKTIKEA